MSYENWGQPTETLGYVAMYASDAESMTRNRDRCVVKARAEGATLKAIAEAAGMTPPGVRRILKRDAT